MGVKYTPEVLQLLNEIFNDLLGQSYEASLDDRQGCGMGRTNGVWLCPQLLTQIVDHALLEVSPYLQEDI